VNPNARAIATKIVDTIRKSGATVNYETETIRILIEDHKLSRAVAAESAERLFGSVHGHLKELHWSSRELNVTPPFDFSENDSRYLVSTDKSKPGHRKRRDEILTLLRACAWKQFENACCKLLELSKCTKFAIGTRSKEGGLDFYGLLHIGGLAPDKKMLFDWRVRVFGQARHIGKKVGKDALHTFNDQLREFSHSQGVAKRKALEWFASDPAPVLGVFVGLEGFSSGALDLAKQNGIITRNGVQVSEFFAAAIASGEMTLGDLEELLGESA